MSIDYKKYIASVKDFPNEGIIFRDITPILQMGKFLRLLLTKSQNTLRAVTLT